MKGFFTFVTLFLVITTCAYGAGNIQAGKEKAAACAACHGADGNSPIGTWPKLAGQHADYIVHQLLEFKKGTKGKRSDAVMYGMAKTLTRKDMEDLAAFYASQKVTPGAAQKSLLTLGQKIYRSGEKTRHVPACMGCHGPTGKGLGLANIPALGGQHEAYTFKQLEAYREGARANDPNNIMQMIAKKMTKREMEAVASYIAGLH